MFKFRPEIKKTLSPVAKLETWQGGGHNFHIFFKRIFFRQNKFEADWEKQKGACSSGKILKIYAVMAILVLFE